MKPSIEEALAGKTVEVNFDPATPSTKDEPAPVTEPESFIHPSPYHIPSAEELGIPRQAPPIFNKPAPLDVVDDQPKPCMTYEEAMAWIRAGKKVRQKGWPPGISLGVEDRGVEVLLFLEPLVNEEATDWEVIR